MAIYPNADTSHRYDGKYGGSYVRGFPARGILHTTETTGRPSYRRGADAPHFTVDPRTGRVWQHFDTRRPARALRHPPGTIDTNNAAAIQIEIVAYSDAAIARRVGGLHIDRLTPDQLRPIAQLIAWINRTHGIRSVSGLRFQPYPQSAQGTRGRMSDHEWRRFSGWAGHQHVPHNTHGDPSDINIAALLGSQEEVADVQITKGHGNYAEAQPLGPDWSQSLVTGLNGAGHKPSLSLCQGPGFASGVINVYTTGISPQQTVQMRCFVVAKNAHGQWARVGSLGVVEQPGSAGAGFYQYSFASDLDAGQRIRFEAHTTGGTTAATVTTVNYNVAVLS
jgi:hypothetical protein